jgi:hypothetical protein
LVDEAKLITAGEAHADQVIRIEGGLPELPGTQIIMPEREGPVIEGPSALGEDPILPKPEPTDASQAARTHP